MKYIKLFEDMHQLSVREFNDVVTDLRDKLNFIGFDLHTDNPITNHHSDTEKEYTITFNFNLNGVKNSILSYFCPLIIKNSADKELPLNSEINFTLNLNYNLLKTYKIMIKYGEDTYKMPSNTIKPLTEEEGYVKCMFKVLDMINMPDGGAMINKTNHAIRDGRISSLLKLSRIFIKDNIRNYDNYIPNIIISNEFMEVMSTIMEHYMDNNIHDFFNFVKKYKPQLYTKLVEIHGKGAYTSSEMGEMGF